LRNLATTTAGATLTSVGAAGYRLVLDGSLDVIDEEIYS